MDLQNFVKKIVEIYDSELMAFVVYGSFLTNSEYSNKFSDINTIIVLKDLSPNRIQLSNDFVKRWMKKGNPAPLFFNVEHIKSSVDVFPIEFLDIKERHKVYYGKPDVFSNIEIDLKNLRHQCESELKGLILKLNSFYSANCDNSKLVANTTVKSWSNIRAIFRAMQYLLGIEVQNDPKKMLENLSYKVGFNAEVFFDIISIREGSKLLPRKREALEVFERYLTELTIIASFIDKYNA